MWIMKGVNRDEVTGLNRFGRVHRVHDLLEDVAEPDFVGAARRRRKAHDHRVVAAPTDCGNDRAIRRCGRVMRFVDDEDPDPAAEAPHEFFEPFAGEALDGRNDDVAIFRRAFCGFLDPDFEVRVEEIHFLDGLLDQLVAVRDHEHYVILA